MIFSSLSEAKGHGRDTHHSESNKKEEKADSSSSPSVLMKVLGGYNMSKTLTEDNMDSVIDLPLDEALKESLADQICDAEKASGQPSGNGIRRWRSLFVQMRRRSAMQCDGSDRCSRTTLFGQPLSRICENDACLPRPIKDILVVLYKRGPSTEGIFRRACNARNMREIKEQLNNGEAVNLEEQSVLLLAALLKDFLRHIPGGLLVEEQYSAWMAALDIQDNQEKCKQLKLVLDSLPKPNILLLLNLLCLLLRITEDSNINMMDANNLAVCISPNLLQRDSVDAAEKVTSLTRFLIENCCEIFGECLKSLLDDFEEEEFSDNLDLLSSHQQDSAYDSPDPDADPDTDIGHAMGDHQTSEVKKDLQPGSVSKPLNRRCSEPIIYPSAATTTQMSLTRSHEDFSMEKVDMDELLLKKQNSDDSFLSPFHWGKKAVPFQKSRGSSAMEMPRNESCKDSSYSSSCSLESASSNISEDSVFGNASAPPSISLLKTGPSPQSFSSICIEDVENRGKVAKRRPLSLRMEKKKTKNRGSMKKENNEDEAPPFNETLQQEAQEIGALMKPRTRPRSLSAMEVFQLVDSKIPSRPPSYVEAVNSSDLPTTQPRPMTVKDARMSKDRMPRPASMIDGVLNLCPTSCTTDGSDKTEEKPAVMTPSVNFRPRAMSESGSRSHHERLSRRVSQPLFEELLNAKESDV
ncbi:T-cell activation Rho GTPase-activating protein-like [Arapaima gigas]